MKKIFKSLMALAITACTFVACEDVPEPYNNPYDKATENEVIVVDPTGSGTEADPYNVTALVEAYNAESPADGSFINDGKDVYVSGVVVDITEISTQYKNVTYYVADGMNASSRFYVFRGKMLNGADVASETDLQVGDSVTICGKVKNYKGTPEYDQGNYITRLVKANGSPVTPEKPADDKVVGSKDAPKTVAEALTAIDAMETGATSEESWYIKGKIKTIKTSAANIAQYHNIDYVITDDGNNELTVFRGKNLNNTDFNAEGEINVGDVVVVYGKLQKYQNANTNAIVPEVSGSYIVSLNDGGGSDTPATDAKAVTIAEFNAAAESNDVWYQLTGTVKNLKDGDLYGNFDLEDATGSVYVYGLLSEKGGEKKKFQELVAAKGIKEGSTITIIGVRGSYNGKIEVMNAYFVSIGEGGNDTPSADVTKVSVADFNAAAESNDVWYQLTGAVKNLKDGDQYGNFDLEDATGSVYVYGLLSEKGGEKKKFQELVAAKGIKEGSVITIIGVRGSYNGKIEVMNAYFVSIEGGNTDTPSDNTGVGTVSGNTVVINADEFGFEDKGKATSATLVDGTKVEFDKADGSTAPAYYAGTYSSVRVYANNTITITAKKNIAKIAITTTDPSSSDKYNGSDGAYAEGGSKVNIVKESDTSVSFSGLNASTVKIVNYNEQNAKNQLRIKQMVITYAN